MKTSNIVLGGWSGRGLLIAVLILHSGAPGAFTYVRPSDESLLQRADVVVAATVARLQADPANPLGITLYRLQRQETFKGYAPAALAVRIPGAADPLEDGALVVPGMPRFQEGDDLLLFLNRGADGSFAPTGYALGAFVVRDSAEGAYLLRDLSAANELGESSESSAQVRDLARFAAWLRSQARGVPSAPGYWRPRPSGSTGKYSLQGNPAARWFEFGEAANVPFYASQSGQVGLLGGGYPEFQAALRAWNDDAGSTVRYVYAGTTAANGGLERADGVNAIHFNDPASNLAGVFDCLHGGVVAYAGWRSRGTRAYAGRTFSPIVEVDIAVQNGAGCVLAGAGNSNASEVFAHEVGHTLGLGHSCSDTGLAACEAGTPADDALMRPFIHGDGRGAALRLDDRNGIAFLYPAFGGAVPPPEAVGGGGNLEASQDSGGGGGGGGLGWLALAVLGASAAASIRARARTSPAPAGRRCRASASCGCDRFPPS